MDIVSPAAVVVTGPRALHSHWITLSKCQGATYPLLYNIPLKALSGALGPLSLSLTDSSQQSNLEEKSLYNLV